VAEAYKNLKNEKPTNPQFEFEGPFGRFWGVEDVPIPSIVEAIAECFRELGKRGYSEAQILEMVANPTERGRDV